MREEWVEPNDAWEREPYSRRRRRANSHDGRGAERFGATWFGDVSKDDEDSEWLVRELIPAGGFVEIYGQPSCGKSFLALDLGMAIARSRPFFGLDILTPGFVAYIGAEGGRGITKRLRAYRQYHELDDDDPPFLLVPFPVNLRNGDDVADLLLLINECAKERGPCVALIVDTVNRSFGGGNENDSEDMGEYIQTLDRIGQVTGAARIIIHHEGKDRNGRGGRGHSSLFAATDTAILVEKFESGNSFTLERQKDGEDGQKFGFRLDVVEVGADERGEPKTSLVVEPADVPKRSRSKPLRGKKAIALAELENLLATSGEPVVGNHAPAGTRAVPLEVWRRAVEMRDILDGANPRQQWTEIKNWLVEANHVSIWNEQAWIVKT
jgi:hypothetical protein